MQAHLCTDTLQGSGEEVVVGHPYFQGAKWMFNGGSPYAHPFRSFIQAPLRYIDDIFMLPTTDPTIVTGRALWIQDSAQTIKIPAFITSSRNEAADWSLIYEDIDAVSKQGFVPETDGNHGSRALWKKYDDSAAYWHAVTLFLNKNFIN